ncbi:hypothetical protein DM02DRAFT_601229, partial [Periconia macrospinosa]
MAWRLISVDNWKKPFDLTWRGVITGELHPSFARHIHGPVKPSPLIYFPKYTHLPVELQLRVVELCDKQTLFQLMHTSQHLRTLAKKLFFSDREAWYGINSEWLFGGGYPGDTNYDINFLASVERLYVD